MFRVGEKAIGGFGNVGIGKGRVSSGYRYKAVKLSSYRYRRLIEGLYTL